MFLVSLSLVRGFSASGQPRTTLQVHITNIVSPADWLRGFIRVNGFLPVRFRQLRAALNDYADTLACYFTFGERFVNCLIYPCVSVIKLL